VRLDIFGEISVKSSAIISLGIKYSMRDVICNMNYCALGAVLRCASNKVNDDSAPCGIS